MLKRLFALGILVFVAAIALPMASAQSTDATVIPDQLNIRATPNGTVLGQLTKGTVISVTGRETDPNNGGTWVLVSAGGTTGWILSDYVQFPAGFVMDALPVVSTTGQTTTATTGQTAAPVPASVAPGTVTAVVSSTANLRGGPGTTFPRLGGVNRGTSITLTGRNADGTWLFGNINGRDAWIFRQLLRNIAGDVNSLPVVNVQVANTTAPTTTTATTGGNNPVPVASGAAIGGFSYGAHIAGYDGVDYMHRAGMTWVKIQVRYSIGDDPNGQAGQISTAHANGFRILLGVVGMPNDVAGGEAYFQGYANYVAGLATLGADAIEVWNEPNLDREWATGMIDANSYTRLLALSYNAIKSVSPGTIVISGAPAPTGFFGGCAPQGCDDLVFVNGMRAAGAAAYMDCMGAHYNEGIVSPGATSGDPRGNFYTRYFSGMVNTYYRAIGKPICFTELGYVTPEGYGGMPAAFAWGNENTLAEHATWIADSVSLAASSGGKVRLVIIWNLNFRTSPDSPDPAGGYAIVRPDGTCPACDALAGRR